MQDMLDSYLGWVGAMAGPFVETIARGTLVLVGVCIALAAIFALLNGAWTALSAAMRREQNARCFLRLLEIGLQQGRTVEETVASMARAQVREMGPHFYSVAALMEGGLSLGAALTEVPQFLPQQTSAMLRVGESTGNVAGILPICRGTLRPGTSDSTKQSNSLMILLLVSPAGPIVTWILAIFILPRFQALAADMEIPFSHPLSTCIQASTTLGIIASALWLLVGLFDFGHSAARSRVGRFVPQLQGFLDRLQFRMPWRRQRLLRDFATLLGALLDGGLPEERAVLLAGDGTANVVVHRRAAAARDQLSRGVSLPDAVASVDDAGEFRWRLRNAGRSGAGFRAALAGWNESLEARAYQQEQLCSQAISTGFVLLNGAMVGLAAYGVFQFLTTAIDSITW